MGKHSAIEVGGEIIAAQVRAEEKAEFYASDAFDHEFCADDEPCYNECPFGHPDEFSVRF